MSNPASPKVNKPAHPALDRAKSLLRTAGDSTKRKAAPVDTVRVKRDLARLDSIYRANSEEMESDQPGNTIRTSINKRGDRAFERMGPLMDTLREARYPQKPRKP